MPREKSRRRSRDRRSSSYSSESSHDRKKSKRRKRRTRSRDRSESNSYRRKRSTSRSRYKRRSYSRSVSRDRYDSKSRRSTSRSRSKPSKHSRDRSNSRSSSHSRSKYKSNKKQRKRSRSTSSRSSSFDIEPRKQNIDDTEIEKAIKAAEAAGLTMTKIPTYEYKEVQIKEDMPTIHDRNLLAELNSDSFVQKSFSSSRNKKQSQNIVIDLNAETVQVPESEIKVQNDDSIINFDEIPSQEELKEMWIKKLYQYRKKMLRDEMQ